MKRTSFLTLIFIVAIGCGSTTNFAQPAKSNSPPQRTKKQMAADDALLEASEKGDAAGVKAALKDGANVNAYSSNGTTPLINVSRAGKYDLVKILLDAGANPVMQDDSGTTAADVVGMFAVGNAVGSGESALYAQVLASGSIREELNSQAKPAKVLSENLIEAILAKDTVKAAALIKQGAYIDFIDKRLEGKATPLIAAAFNGESDIVDLLISSGARIDRADKIDRTALIYAADAGFAVIAEHLIKAGANIDKFDSQEYTPLTAAITGGFIECVQMLINNKVNVNGYLTGSKATPLTTAIGTRHPAIVPMLLKAKADPNKTDVKGATPLMLSVFLNDIVSAKLLLQAGADPNLKNNQGHTALDFAKANSPEIAKILEPITKK
jgi:ankyrin repeat protein